MTAREDLDMMSDVPVYYCRDCTHCENIGTMGGVELLRCTEDGSDHNEHVFTEHHLACDIENFMPRKNTQLGKCGKCHEFDELDEDKLCSNCR
jgi:hypothetical protein